LENGAAAPDFGLTGLFESVSNYESDLNTLRTTLAAKNINYRIFTANVSIQGAKWSRN
jgi:uncharacterized protein (TIGR02599 family)